MGKAKCNIAWALNIKTFIQHTLHYSLDIKRVVALKEVIYRNPQNSLDILKIML